MKSSLKHILSGALLLALTLMLTGCEELFGEWERPTPVNPTPTPEPSVFDALSTPLTLQTTGMSPITVTVSTTLTTGKTIEYSVDGGEWTQGTPSNGTPLTITGHVVQFRGNNASYGDPSSPFKYTNIKTETEAYIYGNVMSLIDKENFPTLKSFDTSDKDGDGTEDGAFAFLWLFADVDSYMSNFSTPATQNIVCHPEKALVLPATTLTKGCYGLMFLSTKLASAPELPSKTLAESCYDEMFMNCTNLTIAPELPATVLQKGCYLGMFAACSNLTTAPALPATSLADNCYLSMFAKCQKLENAPALPAPNLAKRCYESMFSGCTKLIHAPALNALNLEELCYASMFEDCTELVFSPALPAINMAEQCYNSMFDGCTKLTVAPVLSAGGTAGGSLDWACYAGMFRGCVELVNAPELPATTLAKDCYIGMFEDCTKLTTAPVLSASSLPHGCYQRMFYNCVNLSYVKCLATSIDSSCGGSLSNAVSDWLWGDDASHAAGANAVSRTFVRGSSASFWTNSTYIVPQSGTPSWNVTTE